LGGAKRCYHEGDGVDFETGRCVRMRLRAPLGELTLPRPLSWFGAGNKEGEMKRVRGGKRNGMGRKRKGEQRNGEKLKLGEFASFANRG